MGCCQCCTLHQIFFFLNEPEHWGVNMHICEAQVFHNYSQSDCYDLKIKTFAPTIPQSPSPLLTGTNCTPYSPHPPPHVSSTFSMALNATVPYFIEGVVGWGQNPPQRLTMRSCIRDVSFGTRKPRRMERKQKKMREAGACFSLGWKAVQKFLFCISLSAQASDISDCCTLIFFLPTVTQTDIIRS